MIKHKRWQIKPLVFAVFFLFSSMVALFPTSDTANAATQDVPDLYYNADLYKSLSKHQHYWWLYSCFVNNDIDRIPQDEMDGWDWFEGGSGYKAAAIGEMYGGSGRMQCDSGENIKRAFGVLGVDTSSQFAARKAFCEIRGAQYGGDNVGGDTQKCVEVAGNEDWDNNASRSERASSFASVYGKYDPGMNGAMEYMRSYSTFMQACNIKYLNDKVYDSLEAVNDAGAKGDTNKFPVPIVTKVNGDFVLRFRLGGGDAGTARQILVANSQPASTSNAAQNEFASAQIRTCDELATVARQNATAYDIYLTENGGTLTSSSGKDSDDEDKTGVVCSAGALGWVICPLMTIMAEVIQWVSGILEDYLVFNPFTSDSQIKKLWSSLLNVANSLLVIAFLIVIFSQSTSIGLSSYNIKRMLPRIIAAAVLMNLSYYIAQIMVDISNILGVGVANIVSATSGQTFSQNVEQFGVQEFVVGAVGAIAIVAFGLLIPVVLAFLAIFFTIAARNAILVLLIIVAPLAFAAWILPNTEKYFKKWFEMFVNLLLLFPLTMLIFAASIIAANAIMSVKPSNGGGDIGEELNGIIALLVLATPLFALPLLFKTASSALSRIYAATRQNLDKYGGRQTNEFVSKKARTYSKFGAYAAGARAKNFTDKFGDPDKPGAFRRGTRAISRGYTNVRGFDKAVGTSLDTRKQGREDEFKEQGARLAASKYVGGTLTSVGGSRYQEIASAQIDKAFAERKSSIRAAFDQRAPAADFKEELKGFDEEFSTAITSGDAATTGAIVDYLSSARGAGGRQALEAMITKHAGSVKHGSEVHRALNNAINRDNYSTLVSKRGGVAKGGFDYETYTDADGKQQFTKDAEGNFIIKGYKINLAGVGTEQLATQDAKSLQDNFAQIKVSEAKRVLANEELRSKIADDDAFELLEWRSLGNAEIPDRFKETHPDPSPGDDEGTI